MMLLTEFVDQNAIRLKFITQPPEFANVFQDSTLLMVCVKFVILKLKSTTKKLNAVTVLMDTTKSMVMDVMANASPTVLLMRIGLLVDAFANLDTS